MIRRKLKLDWIRKVLADREYPGKDDPCVDRAEPRLVEAGRQRTHGSARTARLKDRMRGRGSAPQAPNG